MLLFMTASAGVSIIKINCLEGNTAFIQMSPAHALIEMNCRCKIIQLKGKQRRIRTSSLFNATSSTSIQEKTISELYSTNTIVSGKPDILKKNVFSSKSMKRGFSGKFVCCVTDT